MHSDSSPIPSEPRFHSLVCSIPQGASFRVRHLRKDIDCRISSIGHSCEVCLNNGSGRTKSTFNSLDQWNIHYSLLFFSILIGMIMAFRPNGIVVNGVLLRSDTASGNLNFYKGMEGFLESFPQAIYQISILLRSARQIGTEYN